MNVYVKTGLWLAGSIAAFVALAHYTLPNPPTHLQVVQDKPTNDNVIVLPVAGCADRTVLQVAQSLREHPEQWTLTPWEIQRGMGWFDGPTLRIWISNADYGLDFNTSSSRWHMRGINYPFTDACRAYLYSATQDFQAEVAKSQANAARNQIEQAVKAS